MGKEPIIVPTIEAVQTDVGFANSFRIELIKLTLTLSTAMLAFTVSFRPSLEDPLWPVLVWIGWLSLGGSTVGGMVNMYGWERYFASFRDHKADIPAGIAARERITARRRAGAVLQFVGFGLGVMAIAVFAALNIDRVAVAP